MEIVTFYHEDRLPFATARHVYPSVPTKDEEAYAEF